MTINFKELRESILYNAGRFVYNADKQRHTMVSQAVFTLDIFSSEDIANIPIRKWSYGGYSIGPSLFRLLDKSVLPNSDTIEFIVKQWMEVDEIIQTVGQKPICAILIMVPPDATNPDHSHRLSTETTITFCYRFEKNNDFDIHKNRLYMNIDGEDRYIPYPDSDKTLMLFDNNYPHHTENDDWRFFWVYDFDTKVSISENKLNSILKDWTLMDCRTENIKK
jgi:hypothetical protein